MNQPECCPAAHYDLAAQIVCQCGHLQIAHEFGHPHKCVHSHYHNSTPASCDCRGFSDKSPWKNALEEAQEP